MPGVVKPKKRLISIQLPEADIAIIDRAATQRGRSRTEFVREAAVWAAEDVLLETTPISMSPIAIKAFLNFYRSPPLQLN